MENGNKFNDQNRQDYNVNHSIFLFHIDQPNLRKQYKKNPNQNNN